ncbi:hypothetical protein M501DRAFT_131036 [Patellaria atrata CBS 101060]|uniref:Uncharacterized protein n=1 Tax=Patellaria atrata CBS 101060 TaxID=1346257 RepID=A0A9P4VSA8_9PEZI|nr:hypothetical protein M501DRAFT_131036 [Patellaria atrata CBS 101060]
MLSSPRLYCPWDKLSTMDIIHSVAFDCSLSEHSIPESQFLSLPVEIRYQIYSSLNPTRQKVAASTLFGRHSPWLIQWVEYPHCPHMNLLAVNYQIRSEYLRWFKTYLSGDPRSSVSRSHWSRFANAARVRIAMQDDEKLLHPPNWLQIPILQIQRQLSIDITAANWWWSTAKRTSILKRAILDLASSLPDLEELQVILHMPIGPETWFKKARNDSSGRGHTNVGELLSIDLDVFNSKKLRELEVSILLNGIMIVYGKNETRVGLNQVKRHEVKADHSLETNHILV